MKPALTLSVRHQLALTPQIQQTIRMLQLGARELGEEIDQVLNNNPLLQDKPSARGSTDDTDSHSSWMQNQADTQAMTLESHLIRQLGFVHLDEDEYLLACLVISRLDDDGYLRLDWQQLLGECAREGIETDRASLESVIATVRTLEPAGIASTGLAQCLVQQLVRAHEHSAVQQHALTLCERLDELARNPEQVRKQTRLDAGEFEQARMLLQSLDPAPGREFEQSRTQYILPDILVTDQHGKMQIRLNPLISRGIELNQYYIELLKTSAKSADREYLQHNLNGARWWMNALEQRNRTLLSVARFMIHHQTDYLDQGKIAIKPLAQREIAEDLGLHVSTVSRAISHKYIQTSSGIIVLSSLLSGSIARKNNIPLSNEAVKFMITEIIKNESSQTPLSDAKITDRLTKRGIIIARRTITKYREQLNIPSSTRRKLL